ncbi:MAG: sulfur oxidation c-type cytochrome SoxX [Rhodospirillales bacterium]|nr:sulfur oxidation c-type cytochrome SoxX [Rhodospirillales bacterium]
MRMVLAVWLPAVVALAAAAPSTAGSDPIAIYQIVGDAIPAPLDDLDGDPARGRAIVAGRKGNCLACHQAPIPEEPFHGNLGPPLDGIGSRASAGALRLRLVAPRTLNPDTVMPAFHQVEGLRRVLAPHRGSPILTAQEIEDVIAYLVTLR